MNRTFTRATVSARAAIFCTLTLAGVGIWFPVRSLAQETQETDRQKSEVERQKADANKRPAAQPAKTADTPPVAPTGPTNPLVLGTSRNPIDTKSNKTDNGKNEEADQKTDYGDFQSRKDDPRGIRKRNKRLPVFGYDFFASARRIIDARRDYYQRQYENDYLTGQPAFLRNSGDRSRSSSISGQNRTRSQQSRNGNDNGNVDGADIAGEIISGSRNRRPRTNRAAADPNAPGIGDQTTDNGSGSEMTDDSGNDTTGASGRSPRDSGAADTAGGSRTRPPTRRSTDTSSDDQEADSQDTASNAGTQRRRTTGTNNNGGTSRRTRSMNDVNDDRTDSNYYDAGSDYPSQYVPRYAPREESVDAFHDVGDPLSQMFRNVATSVPANYQLSTGDTLQVRYSSPTMTPVSYTATVNSRGYLSIPSSGAIVVSGLNLAQVQSAITERLRRLYKNVEVVVSLKELRTISVTVSGAAYAPGTYPVPSVTSAFNLLQAVGGPTEEGSLRRIEVHRQGKLVGTLDMYKYLLGGSTGDIPLQTGDVIYIPGHEAQVEISGEVGHPAVYELLRKETLSDALTFAGGVKPSGVDQSVQINTVNPGTARVIKDVDVTNPAVKKLPLYDGDAVDVFSVRALVANKVTVEGAVDQPGDYALAPGMRVADVISRARGPLDEAYLNRAELYRWNPDNTTTLIHIDLEKALARDPQANVELARWDRLKVYTRQEVAWIGYRKATVNGAVQRPGVYLRSENMHVSDLLRKVGGPTPDAFLDRAVLLHQHGDGTFGYDNVSISEINRGSKSQDLLIEDNDVLAVYKIGEAQFTPEHVVSIRGEVVTPGVYPRGEGMTLTDLLSLSGGFRPDAGTEVTITHARKSVDDPDAKLKTIAVAFDLERRCAPNDNIRLEDGDLVTVQGRGGFLDHAQYVTIKGAVRKPGPISLTDKKMRLSDIIREAGGLRPEAFPEGTEFNRDSTMLASSGQKSISVIISQLNNLLNESKYKTELAKSDIERIKAAGSASQSSSPLGGAAVPNPAAAVLAQNLAQHDLVALPRTLTDKDLVPNGNIAVNLPEALRKPGSNEDILLVDGDTITVPEQPTTVQVIGAVVNGRGVIFRPGASMDYYVSQAGGFAPDAAKDRIQIIHAGGGLAPASKVRELRPGDIILVPTRVLAEKISNNQNGFAAFFTSLTNSAILFRVATGLVGL